MKKIIAPALLALLLSACTATTDNAKKIAGHWRGAAWTRSGAPVTQNAAAVEFTFNEDGNYTYVNYGTQEKGLYKIDGDNLYTTPEGGQDIMVRIVKLTKDSLVFDMNRAGSAETMTLIRP